MNNVLYPFVVTARARIRRRTGRRDGLYPGIRGREPSTGDILMHRRAGPIVLLWLGTVFV